MRRFLPLLVLVLLLNGCNLAFWRRAPEPVIDSETIALIRRYTSQAEDAVKSGDLKRAEELYKRAVILNPNSADLHAKLAGVYVAQDEIEKAINEFKRALVLDPENVPNRNYLGYLYEKLGFYRRAAGEYERALETDPENLYALVHLGLAYRQLNRLLEAEVILKTAADLDPECKNPDSRNLYNYLGLVYQDKGEYDKAIEAYKRSIQLFPDDVWAHNQLGSLYEDLGRLYEAQMEYLETLRYDPQNALALSRLSAIQQSVIAGRINVQPVEISQDDIEAILRESPSAKDYPQADAVVLLNKFSQEIGKNGISRFTVHQIVKVLSWRGVRRYGQVAIPFNRRYQNIGVNLARTHLPDGTVLEPADDAFTDVTPPGLTEFNLFSDMMWKVITMPGVSPGAVIEYQATIEDIRGHLVNARIWFWGGMSFQGYDPVLRSKYALKVPKGQELFWRAYNCDLKPHVREEGDFTVYLWEYGETPALEDEPGMPPLGELVPRFGFSSIGDWDEVARWFNDLIADKRKASPEIGQKVEELTGGLEDLNDKIRAIYDFVASEIRYVGLELGEGTYQPHPAGSVLENGYGDCKDKVMLLLAMLELVGVKAYPVMLSPRPEADVDESLPSLGQFSHLIAAIPQEGGGYLWLDPTAETCTFGDLPFADQGREVLVIKEDGGWEFAETPVFSAERNYLSLESWLKLMPDGAIGGRERICAGGQQGMIHRLAYRYIPDHRLREFLQMDLAMRYAGAKVNEVKSSDPHEMHDPFEISVSFTAPRYPIQAGNTFILMMPSYGFSDMAAMVAKEVRRYSLDLGYPSLYEKKVEILLPSGFELGELPVRVKVENKLGEFERWIERVDGGAIYRMRFKLEQSVVSPEDYPKAKELLEMLAHEDRVSVVIRRVGGREVGAR
jgi:tetratricopeptide (TPR) repeat protein